MLELELTTAAEVDFDDAIDWYRKNAGNVIVHRFIEAVQTALLKIQTDPKTYQIVLGEDVRRLQPAKFPYIIHYRIQERRILILSIFHTSRDPIVWQGRID